MIKRTIFSRPVFSLRRSLRPLTSLAATLCLASMMLINTALVYGASGGGNDGVNHVTIVFNLQGLGNSKSAALLFGGKVVDSCATKQNDRRTGSFRGTTVMFSIGFYSNNKCSGKPQTDIRRATQVGGTVTCTSDNDQACQLAEFDSTKLVTVLFQKNSFTGSLKGAELFVQGKQYGSCTTTSTALTGSGDKADKFEVRFFNQGDCSGTPAQKPSFDVTKNEATISCRVDDNPNCKPINQ